VLGEDVGMGVVGGDVEAVVVDVIAKADDVLVGLVFT